MIELCLLSLLSSPPQDQPGAATAPTTAPERWVAKDAIGAVIVPPWTGAREELARTGLARLLRNGSLADARGLLEQALGGIATGCGLTPDQVLDTLGNGVALAWNGMVDGRPDLTLVVTTSAHPEAFAGLAQRWRTAGTGGSPAWLTTAAGALSTAQPDGFLVIGTVAASVDATVRRLGDPRSGSLADDPAFAARMATAGTAGRRLACCHLRPRAGLEALRGVLGEQPWLLPLAERVPAAAFLTTTVSQGVIETSTRLELGDGNDLLTAIGGTPQRLTPDWAVFVPGDAQGFLLAAVDLGRVVLAAVDFADALAPGAKEQFAAAMAQVRDRCGADVRADVLGNLVDCLTVSQWSGTGQGGWAMRLQVQDATRFLRTLTALLPMAPLPVEDFACEGNPAWRVAATAGLRTPVLTVVGDAVVLASDERSLATAIRQQRTPTPHAGAAAALAAAPPQATWVSVSDPQTELAVATQGASPPATPIAEGSADLPPSRLIVVREDRALRCERTSALGGAWLLAALRDAAGLPALAGLPWRQEVARTAAASPEQVATLRDAETAGEHLDAAAVGGLLAAPDAEVAARAAWLLGRHRVADAVPQLCQALTTRAEPEVRLQAMAALVAIGDARARHATIDALTDDSAPVRTLAARSLGRQRAKESSAALLGMLARHGREQPVGRAGDVAAALLALHDLGDASVLLPAAAAVAIETPETGQALAYLFQQLSPKLPPKDEATALLAVLDHADRTLRRYAIQRLGEMRDPTTAAAIERRLAAEGPELQPLVRVTLAQIRGDLETGDEDLFARATKNATGIARMAANRWSSLDDTTRLVVLGLVSIAAAAVLGMWLARRRARARREFVDEGAAAAALVGASPDLARKPARRGVGRNRT